MVVLNPDGDKTLKVFRGDVDRFRVPVDGAWFERLLLSTWPDSDCQRHLCEEVFGRDCR